MIPLTLEGDNAVGRGIWLKELLKSGTYEVTFTKVSGETRCMPCTLDVNIIPPAPDKETAQTKRSNPDVMSVWCIDQAGWRSFRVMNVTQVCKIAPETTWIVTLEEDPETGDLIMPLPDGLMETQGWEIGDVLEWDVNEQSGTASLTKKV